MELAKQREYDDVISKRMEMVEKMQRKDKDYIAQRASMLRDG